MSSKYDAYWQAKLDSILQKYKVPDTPSTDDIAQVVTYAEAKGCREAVLIYPVPLIKPINAIIGAIQVRTLTFSLAGDLEMAGRSLLKGLSIAHSEA